MSFEELSIPGAGVLTPRQFPDERGTFLEWFREEPLVEAFGRGFRVRQANLSVSRRGVLRGLHYAAVPPGQAKWVTVVTGSVIDYVVDLRVGSPSYRSWLAVDLDDRQRRAVFLSEGLGHAFVALQEDTVVSYLVSEPYNPEREFAINPLDPAIGLTFPDDLASPLLSEKDAEAPTLAEAERAGLLPTWDECTRWYGELGGDGG
jgi:dTDP-4-dehydrorhamnose 3,5-epimerase